jgi:tetratricopeptide (TPR) repeat protein
VRAPGPLAVATLTWLLSGCALASAGGRHGERDLDPGARAYLLDGDTDAAEARLTRSAGAGSAEAAFLLADLLDATGRPEQALPRYVAVLERAGERGTHGDEAVAAAMALVAIRGRVRDPAGRLGSLADDLAARGSRLPAEAWFQLRNLAFAFDRMAGRAGALPERLHATGCLTRFRVEGPLGPRTFEAFDRPPGSPPDPAWARRDLVDASTCGVRAFPRERPEPGTHRAETTVFLERPGEVSFRLETAAAARMRIGTTMVHESDSRRSWHPGVRRFRVRMPAGTARVSVELASPVSAPVFSLAALDTEGRPAFSPQDPDAPAAVLAVPGPLPEPGMEGDTASGRTLARLRAALWWGDFERAAATLAAWDAPSPVLLAARAELAMNDPSLPGEEGFELAARLLVEALEAEPRLWQARSHLARQWSAEGRGPEATELVLAGIDLEPEEPALWERLAGLALDLDWPAELATAVAALERLRPGSCESLAWSRVLARRSGNAPEALRLARRIAACDAGSPALAEELELARRFAEALDERRRLARHFPDSAGAALEEARAAAAAGKPEALEEAARRAVSNDPADGEPRWFLADALLAAGETPAAREVLDRAAATPGLEPNAGELLSGLDGYLYLNYLRIDGIQLIKHYISSSAAYETPAVWVLDRAVHLVGDDGSRTELVHTIAHLRTAEAVEDHGELALPAGARLLRARTVKADGRILEPERVAHKDTVSLPDLEPGDFVETEYASHLPPSPLHPGGFDTGRFFFRDFATAFHRSETVLVVPEGMSLVTDPRGDCPAPVERRLGRFRALTWRVRGGLPRGTEPLAPRSEEFLPSIRVLGGANPGDLAARLREMLAEGVRSGGRIQALARTITGDLSLANLGDAHRALYRWVTDNIEETGDLFEQPIHILERRSGSRMRALLGLCAASGLEARLALVRPAGADDTQAPIPSADLVERLAVLLPGTGWVSLEDDGAPLGWLPPDLRVRPALFVDDGSTGLTDGGALPVDTQEIEFELDLAADGSARGRVVERLRGVLAVGLRGDLRRLPLQARTERFEEGWLARAIPGGRLVSLETRGLDDPEAELVLEWSFEADGFARRSPEGLTAVLPFGTDLVRRLGGLAGRTLPVVLASRIGKRLEARVTLPDGYAAEIAPAPDAFAQWGSITRRVRFDGKHLLVGIDAALEAGRVPPGRYPALLEFARAADLASAISLTATSAPARKFGLYGSPRNR